MTSTQKFIEIIKEKREKIEELGHECFTDSYNIPHGMGYEVVVFADGDVVKTYRDGNSMYIAQREGNAIQVLRFERRELSGMNYIEDYLNGMTEEEIEGFKKYLIKEFKLDPKYDFYEDIDEIFTISNLTNYNIDLIHRLDQEAKEAEIDFYADEMVQNQIDEKLQELEYLMENEEEFL